MIQVELTNRQSAPIAQEQLARGVRLVLEGHGVRQGAVSVAIVDDAEMQQLNARYLSHDYPTDVLSFLLEQSEDGLEGEIIASAPYAAMMARRVGWDAASELLLYVVHGALHLVGYDDQSPDDLAQMRAAERDFLAQMGVTRLEAPQIGPEEEAVR